MQSGKVQTVLGPVDPGDIGITFPHEHMSLDFSISYQPSGDAEKDCCGLTLENLGWIRQNPYSNKGNLTLLDSTDAIIEELKIFKANGGSCLVENSTIGLRRDIGYIRKLSLDTGVHIVTGAGYYVDASRPETHNLSVEEMVQQITADMTVGVDGTDVKCGVIGEVGCTWPLTVTEKRALQASAAAQTELGCGVIVHPGRSSEAPGEIIRILQEAGGDVDKTVMSHLDRTFHDDASLLEFAALGAYCEYDLFGIEVSHYQLADIDMPSDAERIRRIRTLVDAGHGNKVLMAHDVHTKQRLARFGGHGYSHILENIVPKMLKRGLSKEDVDRILIHNPRTWMTIK